jgi:putative transposase
MTYALRQRKNLRLPTYDYTTAGAYSTTICVDDGSCRFGSIDDQLRPNEAGYMIDAVWRSLPERFPGVEIDYYVVMPNHFHAIFWLPGTGISYGDVVAAFKSVTTNEYIRGVREGRFPRFDGRLWQRGSYDRVIRNEEELNRVRLYIHQNPEKWFWDEMYRKA